MWVDDSDAFGTKIHFDLTFLGEFCLTKVLDVRAHLQLLQMFNGSTYHFSCQKELD